MLGSEKGACIICGMSKFKQDCSATKTWWNTESGEVMSKAIISNIFHFLFSKKMWVIRGWAGIHILVRIIANREDPDQTASSAVFV